MKILEILAAIGLITVIRCAVKIGAKFDNKDDKKK